MVVTLQVASEASSATTVEDLPTRTLILDEQNPTAPIGRASKESSKGFVAADNNAWFLSPVVSRKHAELVANFDEKVSWLTKRSCSDSQLVFANSMSESLHPGYWSHSRNLYQHYAGGLIGSEAREVRTVA